MSTDWVPVDACTLPTVEQPLRVREFDELFATAVRGIRRESPTRLSLELDPAAEQDARDLTARETACCGFFSFTFHTEPNRIRLDIDVPANRADVLDALTHRVPVD